MADPQLLEQETLEKAQPRDTDSKAALESKIDRAHPAADKTGAAPTITASDNHIFKNELLAKQYDAKIEARAKIEVADNKLRFGDLESNTTYERNGYLYETDYQGRVVSVTGKLDLQKGVRDPYEQRRVGHLGKEGDQGGHLIATRFNGSPEGLNLVPQDGNLNNNDWKKMEEEWADAINNGKEVQVKIRVQYPDKQSTRPEKFIVDYEIDGLPYHKQITNGPGG